MTLEEAITHALNQAEFFSVKSDCSLYDEAKRYSEYASEYKQLAEWLRELKELKEEFPYNLCCSIPENKSFFDDLTKS